MLKALAATAAAATLIAFSVPVFAADLVVDTPTVPAAPSMSWQGAYIGAFAGDYVTKGGPMVGGELGYLFTPSEAFLLGIEASGDIGTFFVDGFITGKAGVIINDNAAIYGLAGLGWTNTVIGQLEYKVGAGAEYRFDQNWGIDGEAAVWGAFPNASALLQVGVRYHF